MIVCRLVTNFLAIAETLIPVSRSSRTSCFCLSFSVEGRPDVDQTRFTNKSLRTVQMAVKAWRQETALEILTGDWMAITPALPPAKSFGSILR